VCTLDQFDKFVDTLLPEFYTGADMVATRVTQLLDSFGINYRLLPHAEPVYTVAMAAAQRGVVLQEMVKSILLRERRSHRFVMACVTGDSRLDPKAVRDHLPGTWKRLSFASSEEILNITGYVQGSVAPLCLPIYLPVIFDEALARCTKVNISSGDPMAGIELAASDLIQLSKAIIAPIAEVKAG
jgi:prolyl-tRNA editing enzyme YbaK/EbsC (Cys-tRNA(Pro) deacylase)